MPFVLDASVSLAWCFEDEETPVRGGRVRSTADGSGTGANDLAA